MAAPDGSVTTPAKAEVPADWAIRVAADTARSVNSEAIASHALSGFLNFMFPFLLVLSQGRHYARAGSVAGDISKTQLSNFNCCLPYYKTQSV
jgi:hypothetical protein